MRDNSVGHIDSKVVTGITGSSLRHEDEVPGAVEGRAPVRGRCKDNQAGRCRDQKGTRCHNRFPNEVEVDITWAKAPVEPAEDERVTCA
jgi:hypothetical protein